MGGDGAHQGVGAQRAIETILGGKESPKKDEAMSAGEMANYIATAPRVTGDGDENWTYDGCARYAARLILEFLLADPKRAQIPAEAEYERDENGQMVWVDGHAVIKTKGLYETMKEDPRLAAELEMLGLTGFQYGWATNAARRSVELGPVQNPAIVEVGGPADAYHHSPEEEE